MVNMMYQIYIWDNWWLDPEDPIYKISYPCGGREGGGGECVGVMYVGMCESLNRVK